MVQKKIHDVKVTCQVELAQNYLLGNLVAKTPVKHEEFDHIRHE